MRPQSPHISERLPKVIADRDWLLHLGYRSTVHSSHAQDMPLRFLVPGAFRPAPRVARRKLHANLASDRRRRRKIRHPRWNPGLLSTGEGARLEQVQSLDMFDIR